VLFIIAYFTTIAHTNIIEDDDAPVLGRFKRGDYNADAKAYMDKVINYWISAIPNLIDISVAQSEKDLTLSKAKLVTQGWSIVIASWKDILSDYVENDRTLGNLGDMTVVYNYGFLFTYGIGFGFPLLLGLPDDKKSCDRNEFLNTLARYNLQGGITPLLVDFESLASICGANQNFDNVQQCLAGKKERTDTLANIQSLLTEFELVIGTKLSCIDSTENIESQKVTNAVTNLIAAMAARLELELSQNEHANNLRRKLHVNEEKIDLKIVAKEEPLNLLPEPPSLIHEKAAQILTSV